MEGLQFCDLYCYICNCFLYRDNNYDNNSEKMHKRSNNNNYFHMHIII